MKIRNGLMVGLVLVVLASAAHAGWRDMLEGVLGGGSKDTASKAAAVLSNSDVSDGLKEALIKGARGAIDKLGQPGGFMNNPDVKIPLPGKLQTVEKGLRAIGQSKYADQFVGSMNSAAEAAVPLATDIFVDAIKQMSIEDAKSILSGPDDAATSYLKKVASGPLGEKLLPIVKESTDKVGVTNAYKSMTDKLGPLSNVVDTKSLDLDGYVTDKAMDGIFKYVAAEEKQIRQNPMARTTDLLKKVFGGS